ncbi:MAG: chemotaxis protein CheW [Natronospirillum sp.]|uniref:chemotaxis protein CheW n=1 Tax=Natronospirillum sp. TaxID=2812955 RepID=UPI0025ED8ED6|nr:chemotaxis protein CheW [Natronospirillum sp.]MCH8551297.1 chemotaxis protein CheW [Natronospirillum sp.]
MTRPRQTDKPTLQQTPSQALNSYLAIMLEEATTLEDEAEQTVADFTPDTETTAKPEQPPQADLPTDVEVQPPKPEPEPEPEPLPAAETEPEIASEPEPASEPGAIAAQVESETADNDYEAESVLDEAQLAGTEPVLAWQANGRPAWAAQRFDCLLFKVDGLALAVPMVLLGTIYPMNREMTPLFGQPDWFLGLLPVSDGRNIRVIETARLVMPERYQAKAAAELEYAVGIHGCDWALSCHEVVGSITLQPDEVKWRTERTRRPWLAGTVVDQMCALIDLEAFEKVLLSDKKK